MAEISLGARLVELVGAASSLPHLAQALTHPSFANERRKTAERASSEADYQRLEFLGDAVLGLAVGEALMRQFPNAREGELSQLRAHIVSTDALAAFAKTVGLGDALRLGRGAHAAHDGEQLSVLADAVEALVAAVYLDKGFPAALPLVNEIVALGLSSNRPVRDPKSALQELVQVGGGSTPSYQLIDSQGPDHRREFVVSVVVAGATLGTGKGSSKKAAEQEAARAALIELEARKTDANAPR